MRFALILFTGLFLIPPIFAQEISAGGQDEPAKSKIVSRLYQATYGAKERCKSATPESTKELQAALDHFISVNSDLMKLVTGSPYYIKAKQDFSNQGLDTASGSSPESLAAECKYISTLLSSMSDSPEGKNASKEYEAVLSK